MLPSAFQGLMAIGHVAAHWEEYLAATMVCIGLLWFKPTRYVIVFSAFLWILF